MKIKTILSQHRRDFRAIYVCEHCGDEGENYGYDDDNFHRNVIPKMTCPNCGEEAPESYRPLATKYRPGEVLWNDQKENSMKINKSLVKRVLKDTDSTIDDLIKWFKWWKVRKHGDQPCIKGHLYFKKYTFCRLGCEVENHISIDENVVDDVNSWTFPRKFVKNKQFRTEFLAELERMRGEFE